MIISQVSYRTNGPLVSELLKFAHAYTEIHVYPSIIVNSSYSFLLSLEY